MTHSDTTLTLSRIFPYPVEKIFEKYSNPEALTRWWGPNENTNTFHEFDFREGGKWILTMNDGKIDYPNEWTFKKIEKNRIIMDHTVAPYFSIDMTLEILDESNTKMTWSSVFENPEFLEHMRNFLIEKNTENFDRLESDLKNF